MMASITADAKRAFGCYKKYLTRNLPHIMPNMKNSRNPFRNYMIILMKTKDLMISLSNR